MDQIKPGVLKDVQSSNIEAMGHDPETRDFLVQWKGGRVSAYAKVPASLAQKVLESPSPGKAVRVLLVGAHEHRYLTPAAA